MDPFAALWVALMHQDADAAVKLAARWPADRFEWMALAVLFSRNDVVQEARVLVEQPGRRRACLRKLASQSPAVVTAQVTLFAWLRLHIKPSWVHNDDEKALMPHERILARARKALQAPDAFGVGMRPFSPLLKMALAIHLALRSHTRRTKIPSQLKLSPPVTLQQFFSACSQCGGRPSHLTADMIKAVHRMPRSILRTPLCAILRSRCGTLLPHNHAQIVAIAHCQRRGLATVEEDECTLDEEKIYAQAHLTPVHGTYGSNPEYLDLDQEGGQIVYHAQEFTHVPVYLLRFHENEYDTAVRKPLLSTLKGHARTAEKARRKTQDKRHAVRAFCVDDRELILAGPFYSPNRSKCSQNSALFGVVFRALKIALSALPNWYWWGCVVRVEAIFRHISSSNYFQLASPNDHLPDRRIAGALMRIIMWAMGAAAPLDLTPWEEGQQLGPFEASQPQQRTRGSFPRITVYHPLAGVIVPVYALLVEDEKNFLQHTDWTKNTLPLYYARQLSTQGRQYLTAALGLLLDARLGTHGIQVSVVMPPQDVFRRLDPARLGLAIASVERSTAATATVLATPPDWGVPPTTTITTADTST